MSMDHNPLTDYLAPVVASTAAATVRFMLMPKEKNIWTYLRGLVLAGVTSVFAFQILVDQGVSPEAAPFYSGIFAFCADDLLRGLLHAGKLAHEDPIGFLRSLLGLKK